MNNNELQVPIFTMGKSIPKIIHQTYVTKDIPREIKPIIENLRKQNPDWDYRFYDDDQIVIFIKEHYGEKILSLYKSINPQYGAAKADLFRYLLMYKVGGVYLDIKSNFSKPINEVLKADDQYILCSWQNLNGQKNDGAGFKKELFHIKGGEFQQWHIITIAGHPFLYAVIQSVLKNIVEYTPWKFGSGKEGVLKLTGPIAYTLAIYPLMQQYRHRYVRFDKDMGLVYTAMNDLSHHMRVMTKHYSNSRSPIIFKSCIINFLYYLYLSRKILSKYIRDKKKAFC